MKTVACKTPYHAIARIPCPNAATRREIAHKLLDAALVAASGMGIAAMLLLLTVL